MATLLYRLGRTAFRRWPVFVAAWLVALIGIGVLATSISKPMVDTFSIPGIPSLQAQDLQKELFPDTPDAEDLASVTVVVSAPDGRTLRTPAYAAKVDALVADLQQLPQMPAEPQLVNPVAAADGQFRQAVMGAVEAGQPRRVAEANARELLPLSSDGRVGTISWNFDVDTVADVEPATRDALLDTLESARIGGLDAQVNGSAMQAIPETGGTSELVGIAVALVVLVISFGSLVAAGMPILAALVGVGLGLLGISLATAFTTIGTTTPILATMIGLAVGIDYTLFILQRYRTELLDTDDRQEAVGRAVGTAGSAVVFAGLTVLIALSALSVVGIPFLTSMGLAAAGTVLMAVLVALTLLPALLGLLRSKAFGGQVRRRQDPRDADGLALNNGVRWARLVGRTPVAVALLVVIGLGALALPVRSMQLALPTDSSAAADTTQRRASDLVSDAFGPGREAPLLLVVDARDVPGDAQAKQAAFGQVAAWASQQDDVANAQVVATNQDSSGAQVLVTPSSGPDDEATTQLLQDLRDGQSGIEDESGTTVGVTGITAIQTDVSDRLTSALPTYLVIVVGLAFVLLMLVFRSVLVPLTATLGFLLSVLATLGATVLVFQEGLFGLVEGQPLVSFMPIIVIGIVFGLAMDYQVFLVTRMREAFVHGATAREAVVDGFRNSARVVVAAATIMISVFAAFMLQPDSLIKSIGFALAAAVFFDAFVVRMALIPALMYLMGDKAWWLPGWLDRILPRVDVEGEKLRAARAVQTADPATPGAHAATDEQLEPARG
ncbi:putative drug exporter of the RND superfamily [Nocardioides scoriae]|uniref:Putative drug exporter of the RND superfamily n=1 Tax=Nocardioides scoriae TaxID=642780 RepID=A0A1H1RI25_9ACTN|nr:MMPL family transporter [Nocardioides scoriae]SDS35303.1 putative drug exporter of the RND superfamily [Nocardioides scoriae]